MTLLRERTPLHEAPVIATPPSPDGAARSAAPSWIRPGRTLMVASTGGHLEQLYRLRQRFMPELGEVEWATFDTGQSRYLLAGCSARTGSPG